VEIPANPQQSLASQESIKIGDSAGLNALRQVAQEFR
jgi:hypothetical protein